MPVPCRIPFLPMLVSAAALSAFPATAQTGPGGPAADLLDPWVVRAFDPALVPGIAVVVVRGDEVVYLRGFGMADVEAGRPVTPETAFYIASSTKSFLGLAAAVLDQRGTIDLDASVSRYLPQLRLAAPLSADSITLRDLLTHTHGIDSDGGGVAFRVAFSGVWTHEGLLELLAEAPPAKSGRDFRYSNIGYNVVSLALDQALQTSWKEVLAWEIFRPLGMEATTAYVSRVDPTRLAWPYRSGPSGQERIAYMKTDSNMHAAGGMVTTARDLSAWMRANLNEGRLAGRQVLPAEAVAEAQRPMAAARDEFDGFTRRGYSLGLHHGEYDGDRMFHHFGGFTGFHAHISYLPDRGLGVAVLANNAAGGSTVATTVAKGIYDALLRKPDLAVRQDALLEAQRSRATRMIEGIRRDRERRAARSQALPRPLEDYTGTFESRAAGRVEWTVASGKLRARLGYLESEVEVFDGAQEQLRVEFGGSGAVASFRFEGGEATAVVISGQVFQRVR